MTLQELPDIITVKQLSAYLRISLNATYELMRSTNFPTLRIGKRMLVSKENLMEWIDETSLKNKPYD